MEQLTLPEWTTPVEDVEYEIAPGDKLSKHVADKLFEAHNLFSLTFDYYGDIEVTGGETDDFRLEDVYLKFYSTGSVYIQFYQKHNPFTFEIDVTNDFNTK